MLGGAALELKIAILQYRCVGPRQAKVQRTGNDSRAGSFRLGCAWRCRAQGTPGWETSPPPSGVLLGGLSKYPRAGAVSLDALRSGSRLQRKRPPTEAALLVSNNPSELLFQPCVLLLKRFDGALEQQHIGRLGRSRQRTRWCDLRSSLGKPSSGTPPIETRVLEVP
jgi:hypothetical protein